MESPLLYFDLWPLEPLRAAVQSYYLLELGEWVHSAQPTQHITNNCPVLFCPDS
jgi:hypothetical protein